MAIQIVRDLTALMRHEVRVGPHVFTADAGIEDGGEGLGPGPHDLYDSALGACEALTVLWYAKRKGIPVENIEVTVERDQSEERTGIYRLATKLKLGGKLLYSAVSFSGPLRGLGGLALNAASNSPCVLTSVLSFGQGFLSFI